MSPPDRERPSQPAGPDDGDARIIRRRFLVLRALRWLPSGLTIPVLVLLLTERGFSLTTIGAAAAAQGAVVFCLELPTGGFADALGRRPVLVGATIIDAAAILVLATCAHTLAPLILAWSLMGVHRALESGPLDAWFVDASLAADPGADIEAGLAAGGAVLGVAIASGSLAASAIVGLAPIPGVQPLVGPLVVALGIRLVEVVALQRLMTEVRPPVGLSGLLATAHSVPTVVREALATVRESRALVALVSVEFFWGIGMVTWETLMPPRLEQVMGSSGAAASLLGPVVAAAWLTSAVAAALVPRVSRRFGPAPTAAAMRVGQGLTVLGMGIAGGPVGIVAAYLATYAIHGAANPVHLGLLHREVDGRHRTTVLSVNSMMALSAGAVGGIVLGALADGAGLTTATVVGAVVIAAAAPLYLRARTGNDGQAAARSRRFAVEPTDGA